MTTINEQLDIITQAVGAIAALQNAQPPASFYTARTDRTPQPKPALPTLGNVVDTGFVFRDPTFDRRLMRVTDRSFGDGSFRVSSNAHLSAWNADASKFYVMNSGGTVLPFAFNAAKFTATAISARPYSQTEPQFSRIDPDLLYTIAGPNTRTIRKHSFSKGFATDVLELDTIKAGLANPRTYVGGLLSAGNPEILVAFFGGQGQDAHHYVLWYPLAGLPFKVLDTQARLGCTLHSAAIDLSGRYVFLYPRNAQPQQVILWDTTNDALTPVTTSPYGHDALGYGEWVNMDNRDGQPWDAAQWQFRELSNLTTTRDLIDPILTPKEVYLADHSNWNHAKPDRRVPIISGTYRFVGDPAAPVPPWRAWDDEIIGVSTEGPSTVWRFCHHRSDVRDEKNPAGVYFWYEPIVNVSPDGKWALFTSNWDKTLGPDPTDPGRSRQDVFLVELT